MTSWREPLTGRVLWTRKPVAISDEQDSRYGRRQGLAGTIGVPDRAGVFRLAISLSRSCRGYGAGLSALHKDKYFGAECHLTLSS